VSSENDLEVSRTDHGSAGSARRRWRWTFHFQGGLYALCPLWCLIGLAPHLVRGAIEPITATLTAIFAALLLGGAVSLDSRPLAGRTLATIGFLGGQAMAWPIWLRSPMVALAAAAIGFVVLSLLWSVGDLRLGVARTNAQLERAGRHHARATGSAIVAVAGWALIVAGQVGGGGVALAAEGTSLAIASILGATWAVSVRHRARSRAIMFAALACMAAVGVALVWPSHSLALTIGTSIPLSAALASLRSVEQRSWLDGLFELIVVSPSRLLVATFAAMSLTGGVVLALPFCGAGGRSVGFIDGLFTAVSACCVTGLAVRDTEHGFTPAGQIAILVLIQLGGLGIMTLSTAAMAAWGRRLSLQAEGAMAELVSSQDRGDLHRALFRVLAVTGIAEAAGALALTALFRADGDSWAMAAWRGVFHSISAFCNAGFSLQSDSLVPYQHDHAVLWIISLLIIVGGVSPAVVVAVPALVRRRYTKMNHKIVLAATAFLLAFGAVAFATLEWGHSLAGLSLAEKLTNAWFSAVTPRTAGFNSIDFAQCQPATLVLIISLMFIGGSPSSTAGGIKTTTAAVLSLAVGSSLRGRSEAVAFGRRIPIPTIIKAAAIATLGILIVATALTLLLLTQTMRFDQAAFEVVSALGTVGLSIGGTALLDEVGKVVIIICMFTGRVGPLSLFLFLSSRSNASAWEYPEETLDVG
jgi:trk system potassium uptake protein TrkH